MKNAFRPSERGAALIIVLSCLVLLVVLATAFLLNSASDLLTSKSHAEGGRAVQLGDSAVSLVLAQIEAATAGESASGKPLAWASQPGMIRTYDDAGNPAAHYKLYSWSGMSGNGAFSVMAGEENPPLDWEGRGAIYVDLNAPRASAGGRVFPIVDGNHLRLIGGALTYDENGDGSADIPGFAVRGAPNGSASQVPMPVRWLYVLSSGALVLPSAGTGGEAIFSGSGSPTAEDPIVGRIAFWTDDDTSRININTASEGTYADSPRLGVASRDDLTLQNNSPVAGEFQRYPGHPATTSLSGIFSHLTAEELQAIAPRISTGGSQSGTVKTALDSNSVPMIRDPKRLFASVDELWFAPKLVNGVREPTNPGFTPGQIGRAGFFLTPFSRAPEVNLFGLPRISIWPIHSGNSNEFRSPYDRMMAFCTTSPGPDATRIFSFLRENPASTSVDLPDTAAASGLGRNRRLLEYLRGLTGRNIPGFGGNFSSKYSATDVAGLIPGGTTDRDQILTEIFDYIRATNLADVTVAKPYAPGGQVAPIIDANKGTRGFGRHRTLQGGNLLFIGSADHGVDASVPEGSIRISAMFIPQFFDVAVGSVFNRKKFSVRIEGLNAFEWDNGTGYVPMGFPASVTCDYPDSDYWVDGVSFGDQMGIRQIVHDNRFPDFVSDANLTVPVTNGGFDFRGGDVTFVFLGPANEEWQRVTIRFGDGRFPLPQLADGAYSTTGWNPQGPFNLRTFEGRRAASRDLREVWVTSRDVIRSVSTTSGDVRLIAARKEVPGPDNPAHPFSPNVRYADLSKPVSGAHNLWSGDGYPFDHTVGKPGTLGGKLVRDLGYSTGGNGVFPDVPLNGVAVGKKTSISTGDVPGDWDTGVAELRDGPFINKPDEGDKGANPYKWKYHVTQNAAVNATQFSPNRMVSSAVMFGSLPSGVLADRPWQTLLFRPGPANHPGLGTSTAGRPPYSMPPDHLLLDLFWMPVVEPYAISEPFATAGKINMNYEIVPFPYIQRDTGIRAVLAAEKVIAIKDSDAGRYKTDYFSNPIDGMSRRAINVDETLTGFTRRFESGDIFRSAAEICSLDIVPDDYTGPSPYTRASMDSYWSTRLLTGDNCRERIYATLYPRLTTQSNTYTIHFRAQALQKRKGSNPAIWNDATDVVTGDVQGSETIERFLDPNNPEMPDYSVPEGTAPISSYYHFRTLEAKVFAP